MAAINPVSNVNPLIGETPDLTTGNLGRQDFLQLLVTQLRHQDPLDPMNDREFIAQMAQLSTLETTSGLAARVNDMVAAEQQTQALQMVGREVEFTDPNGVHVRGRVSGARLGGGMPVLLVEEYEVPVSLVETVL